MDFGKKDAVLPNEAIDLGVESNTGNSADPIVINPDILWTSSVRTSSVVIVPILIVRGTRLFTHADDSADKLGVENSCAISDELIPA